MNHAAPMLAKEGPFASQTEPQFERVGEGRYLLTSDPLNTELDLAHVRRDRHQLYGELTVRTGLAGVRTVYGTLFVADVNLSGLRSREDVARAIADRTRTPEMLGEWRQIVDDLATCVGVAEREGEPGVPLDGVAPPARHRDMHRVHGFTLPKSLPAMLFGDGDSGKTYAGLAIGVELARKGVPTGIVDAEMSVEDSQDRVARLTGGASPGTLLYIGCARPLIYERDRIAEMVRAHGLQYLIFDSVGFLTHDKPEAADSPLQYFRAVRGLGKVGSLHLAHTTKGEGGDQRPFGSTFWFNSVRALWYAKRADASAGELTLEVAYMVRKFNLGTRPPTHGLRFTFDASTTRVASIEPASLDSLAPSMPIKERVKALLRSGPKELEDIAAQMPDADGEAISRTIRRYTGDKAKVQLFTKLSDGRYALVERRYS